MHVWSYIEILNSINFKSNYIVTRSSFGCLFCLVLHAYMETIDFVSFERHHWPCKKRVMVQITHWFKLSYTRCYKRGPNHYFHNYIRVCQKLNAVAVRFVWKRVTENECMTKDVKFAKSKAQFILCRQLIGWETVDFPVAVSTSLIQFKKLLRFLVVPRTFFYFRLFCEKAC